MPFVLDASVTAAWLLPDETDPITESVLELLSKDYAFVPAIWWYEIRNIMIIGERRKRLRPADTSRLLSALSKHPIILDSGPAEAEVLRLARDHQMTIYDAVYVELAARRQLPLATLDYRMAAAAELEAVVQVR